MGEDAHLHMSDDDYDHEAADYFYSIRNCRDRLYRDWGKEIKDIETYFFREFDVRVSHDKVIEIFIDILADHCLN